MDDFFTSEEKKELFSLYRHLLQSAGDTIFWRDCQKLKKHLIKAAPVSKSQVGIFNVTFEPGCRNNWHIHHAKNGGGQILVCVAGRGYYQEEGKEAIEMKTGDCINIPAEVKHWHGAAPDSWFSHLAVEVPGEETSNEWCEPVSDEEYAKLK